MRKTALLSRVLAAVLVSIFRAAPAAAEELGTWVSGVGNDANACTREAPCRTFGRALQQTRAGGTIGVLDSADFGRMTIRKAISIVAEGAEGLVLMQDDTPAIVIDVGTSDVVHLHGLIVDGGGGTYNSGVVVVQARAVHIQNSVIRGFAGADKRGLVFGPKNAASELHVSDTLIANNGGGLLIRPSDTGGANVVLKRVHVEDNGFGIKVDATATTGAVAVSVVDSVSAGNTEAGIDITRSRDPILNVMIDRSTFAGNGGAGVYANGAAATIRMGNSIVTGNKTGVGAVNNGKVLSYRTNQINGNTTDGAPTSTITTQ